LLNELFTCATPAAMFFRSLRLGALLSRAIYLPLLLLASDCSRWAFARPRIGVCPLTAHRQITTMTQATVAALVHQTLNVHLGFTTQVTFNGICGVNMLTNSKNFRIAQLVHATGLVDVCARTDFLGRREANSSNVS